MQFKQSCLESHAFDALHVGNLPSSSQRTGCVREQLKKKVQEFIYAQSVVDASTQNVGGAQPFVEHMYVCTFYVQYPAPCGWRRAGRIHGRLGRSLPAGQSVEVVAQVHDVRDKRKLR